MATNRNGESFCFTRTGVIPALSEYLADDSVNPMNRIAVPDCIASVGTTHPGLRDECISVLTKQLEAYRANSPELNAFVISGLDKLKAN